MQTQSTEAVVCLLREGSDALTTHILKTHHTQGKGDTVGVKLLTSLTKSLRLFHCWAVMRLPFSLKI